MGRVLGYGVTVCDARPVFATSDRFPLADEVVVDWPDPQTWPEWGRISDPATPCASSPMTKFDVPAIMGALATRVGYLGAMGSR